MPYFSRVMAEQLAELAEEARLLIEEPHDSPKVKLWKREARDAVEAALGESYVKLLNETLFFRRAISRPGDGQTQHRKAFANAAELLDDLAAKQVPEPEEPEEPEAAFVSLEDLHPEIASGCRQLFDSGSYVEAVEKSFKIVRDRLRQLTGYETGSDAFGKGHLRVEGASADWVADDFNEGVKFLTMAIDKFRNEKAHVAMANLTDPIRAAEYLCMSSLAMRLLDQARPQPESAK